MADFDGAFPVYTPESTTKEGGWDGGFPVWINYTSPVPPPVIATFVAEILIGNDVVYQLHNSLPQQELSIDVTHYTGILPIKFRIRRLT